MNAFPAILHDAVRSAHQNGVLAVVVGPGADPELFARIVEDETSEKILVVTPETLKVNPNGDDGVPTIVLLRDKSELAGVVTIDLRTEFSTQLFISGGKLLGLHQAIVEAMAEFFAPALRILTELDAWDSKLGVRTTDPSSAVRAGFESQTFTQEVRRVAALGDLGFELGRVLVLIAPDLVEVSDEWADMAGVLADRRIALAAVTRFLLQAPDLLWIEWKGDVQRATFANPFARTVLGGLVPVSQSEHLSLYQWLRRRAVNILNFGGDSSDEFVKRQLAVQAARGGSLGELLTDPAAILCSDIYALAEQVEAQPATARSPHGKMFLQAANYLQGGGEGAGHLEQAALRIGDHRFVEALDRQLPYRSWRCTWNKSDPVNANRVVVVANASVLDVAAVRGATAGEFIASCSDGRLWQGHPYGDAAVVFDGSDSLGEIRACDAIATPTGWLASAVTSDQKVLTLTSEAGLSWMDDSMHSAPLSCVAIGQSAGRFVVASSGVDGELRCWDAVKGTIVGIPHFRKNASGLAVEIRGIEFVGDSLVTYCAGDGVVGLLDVVEGTLLAEQQIGCGALNAISARNFGSVIDIVVGTSDGSVAAITWNKSSKDWSVPKVIATHSASVNGVDRLQLGNVFYVISAGSDRRWRMTPYRTPSEVENNNDQLNLLSEQIDPICGHYGAVWDISVLTIKNRSFILTGGSEGICRFWVPEAVKDESLRLERPARHTGPVNAVQILRIGDHGASVFTGGADGKIWRWLVKGGSGSRPLLQAPSGIADLVVSRRGSDSTEQILAATDHGAILQLEYKSGDLKNLTTLGISPDPITALCVLNGGNEQLLVSGGADGGTALWNLDRPGRRKPIASCGALHNGSVTSICRTRDNESAPMVVVATQDGFLSFRSAQSLLETYAQRLRTGITQVRELPLHEHGWASSHIDGYVSYFTSTVGLADFKAHDGDALGIGSTVLGGRTVIATVGLDRCLRLWDLPTLELLNEIKLDGIPLGLHVAGNFVSLSTTSGAAVFEFSDDFVFLGALERA